MEVISSLPETLVPIAIVLYYVNQNNVRWMAERKEIAEAVLAERKEWLVERRDMLERQFGLQERLTETVAALKAENHALRGTIQQLLGRLEMHFFGGRTDNRGQ